MYNLKPADIKRTTAKRTTARLISGSNDRSSACHGKSYSTKTWNELVREQGIITKKKG